MWFSPFIKVLMSYYLYEILFAHMSEYWMFKNEE